MNTSQCFLTFFRFVGLCIYYLMFDDQVTLGEHFPTLGYLDTLFENNVTIDSLQNSQSVSCL